MTVVDHTCLKKIFICHQVADCILHQLMFSIYQTSFLILIVLKIFENSLEQGYVYMKAFSVKLQTNNFITLNCQTLQKFRIQHFFIPNFPVSGLCYPRISLLISDTGKTHKYGFILQSKLFMNVLQSSCSEKFLKSLCF